MMALAPGEKMERDLSWLDRSLVRDFSPDGRTVLFLESGEGAGATYAMYIRKTDGGPAIEIGEGSAAGLSPDGKWALSIASLTSAPQLILYPTGTGEPRPLPASRRRWRQTQRQGDAGVCTCEPDIRRWPDAPEPAHCPNVFRCLLLGRPGI